MTGIDTWYFQLIKLARSVSSLVIQENFIKLLGPVRDVLGRQMRIRVLKSVPLLARLTDAELDQVRGARWLSEVPPMAALLTNAYLLLQVGNAMRVQLFEPNQYIVREGEPGSRFYIINEGVVKCCKRNPQGKDEEMLRLHDQEYFGERALLTDEPRAASVVAVTRAECLVLERSDFNNLLGDLESIMQQEVRRREELSPGTLPRRDKSKKSLGASNFAFSELTIVSNTLPYKFCKERDRLAN